MLLCHLLVLVEPTSARRLKQSRCSTDYLTEFHYPWSSAVNV